MNEYGIDDYSPPDDAILQLFTDDAETYLQPILSQLIKFSDELCHRSQYDLTWHELAASCFIPIPTASEYKDTELDELLGNINSRSLGVFWRLWTPSKIFRFARLPLQKHDLEYVITSTLCAIPLMPDNTYFEVFTWVLSKVIKKQSSVVFSFESEHAPPFHDPDPAFDCSKDPISLTIDGYTFIVSIDYPSESDTVGLSRFSLQLDTFCSDGTFEELSKEIGYICNSVITHAWIATVIALDKPSGRRSIPDIGTAIRTGLVMPMFSGFGPQLILAKIDNLLFDRPTAGKSIELRLRQADIYQHERQKSDQYEFRLLFAVSALEALLGRKSTGIADDLARSVSALLQPEPRRRAELIKLVKKIYNSRSRTVHGEAVGGDLKKHDDACMIIVLGISYAVHDWHVFYRRMHPENDPSSSKSLKHEVDALFDQIDDSVISGRPIVGVGDQVTAFANFLSKYFCDTK